LNDTPTATVGIATAIPRLFLYRASHPAEPFYSPIRSMLLPRRHTVGYESPSPFSREYRRLFGAPPVRDIERLRASASDMVAA
jgi:hypothetical protein